MSLGSERFCKFESVVAEGHGGRERAQQVRQSAVSCIDQEMKLASGQEKSWPGLLLKAMKDDFYSGKRW